MHRGQKSYTPTAFGYSVTVNVTSECHRWKLWIMSTEQGKKRLLSPGSINLADDKQRRNDSLDIDNSDTVLKEIMEPEQNELSLLNLKQSISSVIVMLNLTASKGDLKALASKGDLKELDDRIVAQNQEIGQLRDELKSLKTNFDSLQANVDGQLAASLASGAGSLGRDPGRIITNMASAEGNNLRSSNTQRQNLVIEGLIGESFILILFIYPDIYSSNNIYLISRCLPVTIW